MGLIILYTMYDIDIVRVVNLACHIHFRHEVGSKE